MNAHLAIATLQPGATSLRAAHGVGPARAALTSWLLGSHAQIDAGQHAGAVAGCIDRDGKASYVYPEITGYYLQWLAWRAACDGANDQMRRRAASAQRWLLSWATGAETPATRMYIEPPVPDWRNSALFFFDLAMVLRGVASATRLGLIEPDPELVERIVVLLLSLVADDGLFDACKATSGTAQVPDRWSTRRGPFLAKAASGVLMAAAQFPSMPRELLRAADMTFSAALEAMSYAPHSETHPLLYGIEGALSVPEHAATIAAMPQIVRQLRNLLERSMQVGHVPESLDVSGPVRLDIVAQAIRAARLLLPEHVGQMPQVLVGYIDPGLGVPFSPTERPVRYNVWTAMFAEQALCAADSGPDGALLSDLRRYLV
jgi:hypothetical protein